MVCASCSAAVGRPVGRRCSAAHSAGGKKRAGPCQSCLPLSPAHAAPGCAWRGGKPLGRPPAPADHPLLAPQPAAADRQSALALPMLQPAAAAPAGLQACWARPAVPPPAASAPAGGSQSCGHGKGRGGVVLSAAELPGFAVSRTSTEHSHTLPAPRVARRMPAGPRLDGAAPGSPLVAQQRIQELALGPPPARHPAQLVKRLHQAPGVAVKPAAAPMVGRLALQPARGWYGVGVRWGGWVGGWGANEG